VVVKDSVGNSIRYAAKGHDTVYVDNNTHVTITEKLSPVLTYPPVCGCRDADYLEYSPAYACDNFDLCRTHIVFGCMDSQACNFDPDANFNIQSLCCYPGNCSDRDLDVVCPSLKISERGFKLYPNPAQDQITMKIFSEEKNETKFAIYNAFGRVIIEKELGLTSGIVIEDVDLSKLEHGLYLFRLIRGDRSESITIIKN